MCECGCGELNAQYRMPGPDGKTYVLGVYDSCKDCDTPAGVDISLMTDEEMKDYDYIKLPWIDFTKPMIGIAVMHPRVLRTEIEKYLARSPADEDMCEVVAEELMDECFRPAVRATTAEYQPAVQRKRRRG